MSHLREEEYSRPERLKQLNKRYPIYYDECWSYYRPKPYPSRRKRLLHFEVRMYRTWKYNRKTQYKMKDIDLG